jgi:ribosomal protein L7/L12
MKIKSRDNVKGNIVSVVEFENKDYIRIQKSQYNGLDMQPVVEWKKVKTNHLVKSDKHITLEEAFKKVDTITKPTSLLAKTLSSGTTVMHDFVRVYSNQEKIAHEKTIKEFFKNGSLLGAVKYYKDITGVGLKEAKDYIDALYSGYKWDNAMVPTMEAKSKQNSTKY